MNDSEVADSERSAINLNDSEVELNEEYGS